MLEIHMVQNSASCQLCIML